MENQKGQILIILVIGILVFFALTSVNIKHPEMAKVNNPITCQTVPQGSEQSIDLPPVKDSNISDPTRFIKVRTQVPISESFFRSKEHYSVKIKDLLVDGKKFDVYYPEKLGGSGEICVPQPVTSKYRHPNQQRPCKKDKGGGYNLYFPDFGIIFLVEKDSNGEPIKSAGVNDINKPQTFWLTQVYQQENELKGIGTTANPLPDFALACAKANASQTPSPPKVSLPNQSPSADNKQLQLEYFVFESDFNSIPDGWSVHCKPAVYLYPETTTAFNVKVYPQGVLTLTIPEYPKSGWTGIAKNDGTIIVAGKTYPYLYYEAKIKDEVIKKPQKGFVTSFGSLPILYYQLLTKLGLNSQQTQDFIEYWQKSLPFSPYYFVGVMDQENINDIEALSITPKPVSLNRVHLYFEPLDTPKQVEAPELIEPKTNNGFKVVEWGGIIKVDKNSKFTCSQ